MRKDGGYFSWSPPRLGFLNPSADHNRAEDGQEATKVRPCDSKRRLCLLSIARRIERCLAAQPQGESASGLRIRDGRFEGVAREITDPTEWQQAKKVYAGTVNPFDRMEYRMHRPDRPTVDRIQEMHEKWFTDGTPVVIELSS
jgi:hypothetical protein